MQAWLITELLWFKICISHIYLSYLLFLTNNSLSFVSYLGFTVQCGKSTTLACLGPKDHTENKTINALWKKASGERVIWNYYGVSDRGETFKNRTKLNANLSLSIDECYQSDQGIYILCFNGEPRCHVRLFVQGKYLSFQMSVIIFNKKIEYDAIIKCVKLKVVHFSYFFYRLRKMHSTKNTHRFVELLFLIFFTQGLTFYGQ